MPIPHEIAAHSQLINNIIILSRQTLTVGLAILAYGGYHLNLAKKEAARLAAAGSPKPATKGAPDKVRSHSNHV